ncbi:MAG: methyltransferase domain-containing protein [Pseudobutyrivibrio sp.]|uniref:bifunctional Gfo/Idh/MocA family oxidoreductase/class I SAM-dependent methyltransferase n=1 Tax=Pseudobutyrivibrio sp. TaxID=2014367 RepID=UPI0025E24FAA|nr:bifunctional Gfo/Idh/MocA family oxidoreductase/class I SAM-dependent methyltransferase [Pseudobutyrivibrio sp.]MBE5903194.1 methyltransferase domain-containing protein [Pseudobutyrivibrio sp.]
MNNRIIVCGTRFGQFYLEAAKSCPQVELAGIMSTGSKQSKDCAEKYNVPIYTDCDSVTEDCKLVAVAIKTQTQGGKGTEIARTFLEKGKAVILEQPVSKKEIVELYQLAAKNKTGFMVGDHYAYLPAVKEFIEYSKVLMQKQKPIYINIDMATQVSFSCCHILALILGKTVNVEFEEKINKPEPFKSVQCKFNGIPVNIRGQNQIAADVSDNYMHLFFRISVGFPTGTITLEDVHGPVVYRERMTIPNLKFVPSGLKDLSEGQICDKRIKVLFQSDDNSYRDVLTKHWVRAIEEELVELKDISDGRIKQSESAKKGAAVIAGAALWSDIMGMLGYPDICDNPEREYISFEKIRRMRYKNMTLAERFNSLTKEHIDTCVDVLGQASMLSMVKTFQNCGLFLQCGTKYSMKDIIDGVPHKSNLEYIIGRWIKVLVKAGIIQIDNNKYSLMISEKSIEDLPKIWARVEDLWCDQIGPQSVFKYFYSNSLVLNQLFTGEKTAVEMLFTGGEKDIADDLYQYTMIAYAMNQFIADYIVEFTKKSTSKIRILEIGGGTGATSKVIWKKISQANCADKIANYHFTDLSEYFTDSIKEIAENYSFVTTGILNAEEVEAAEIEKESFDIIVAAGVINNVKNTLEVMKSLGTLLKKDGLILMSEATGEALPMLISQVFMMEDAADDRSYTDTTFLSLSQWEKCFYETGYKELLLYPDSEDKLDRLGQKVFVLKKESN